MATKKTHKTASPAPIRKKASVAMIFDPRQKKSYSVVDVAGIAAGCKGMTPKHRIFEALDLLAAAEEVAGYGPNQTLEFLGNRHIPIMTLGEEPPNLLQKSKDQELSRACRIQQISDIIAKCDRDPKTKRIKRTSMVHQAVIASGGGKNSKFAQEKFGYFVREVVECQQGEGPKITQKEYLSRFESGIKTKLLNSDTAAAFLADHFLRWLESSKNTPSNSSKHRLHSNMNGTFVSKSTRGAHRDNEGKFSQS